MFALTPNSRQIQLSASSRGITDHFFCFICDEYLWNCSHLLDNRLAEAEHVEALQPSPLLSFAYNGMSAGLLSPSAAQPSC
jgi:hypothetical protein